MRKDSILKIGCDDSHCINCFTIRESIWKEGENQVICSRCVTGFLIADPKIYLLNQLFENLFPTSASRRNIFKEEVLITVSCFNCDFKEKSSLINWALEKLNIECKGECPLCGKWEMMPSVESSIKKRIVVCAEL